MSLARAHERPTLPPVEQRARIPEIAKVGEEVAKLRGQHDKAARALDELNAKREEAEAEDTKLAAAAVRAGKPHPKPAATIKAEQAVETQKQMIVALEIAVGDAEAELVEQIAASAPTAVAGLDAEIETQREQVRKAISSVREAVEARDESRALRDWLKSPPHNRFVPGAFGNDVGMRKASGEAMTVGELLAAVEASFLPPAPPAPHVEPTPPQRRPSPVRA